MKRFFAISMWVALLVAAGSFRARGMAGDLRQPSLAFPANVPPELRSRILAIVGEPECKFVIGHFLNAHTTLEYNGDTAALNRLIRNLAACDGIRVHVSFSAGTGTGEATSWSLSHSAWADSGWMEIQVNAASPQIKLAELDIPPFGKGEPPPAPATAKQAK